MSLKMQRPELYELIESKANTIVGASFVNDFDTIRKQMAELYKTIADKFELPPDEESDLAANETLQLP